MPAVHPLPGSSDRGAGLRAHALRVHGVALESRWIGAAPDARPTLVFLHGGLACAATWHDFPEMLAEATGCGALVYSRRGHGRSQPGPARWPVSFMHSEARRWLPAVLRQAGVRRPILVGHSDGASIGILYAAARPAIAPRPLGLALLAPHVLVEERTITSIEALTREPAQRGMLARLRRRHGRRAKRLFAAWTGVWLRDAFRSWSIEAEVARIARPMLVVQGDADEFGTLAQVEAIRARAPVKTCVLKGCGHVPYRDRRAETLEAVATFVEGQLGIPMCK